LITALSFAAACSHTPAPGPTPIVTQAGSPPPVVDCATAIAQRMSVEELAGQVIMVGTKLASPTSVNGILDQYHVGGVFLAGRSTQTAASLHTTIDQLQARAADRYGTRLLIAVDQEGGSVQTLSGTDFPPIDSAVRQGLLPSAQLRAETTAWAQRLAAAGVNMDLAPVADTVPPGLGDDNPPIGRLDRQYGSDPQQVAADIAVVVSAVQSSQVLATLKHFPGLGRVSKNTDTSPDAVDDVATMDDPYLEPFLSGIHAGAEAVMISSARYPKIDPDAPAVFSDRVITELLRGRLGFTGLVVSDDLGDAVAVRAVATGERAVRFVQAGGSLVLTVQQAAVAPMVGALTSKAQSSADFQARLRQAATVVLRSKGHAGALGCLR
jgi:beta-N-acetylhexosaminidase